jgi:hypothetical protein
MGGRLNELDGVIAAVHEHARHIGIEAAPQDPAAALLLAGWRGGLGSACPDNHGGSPDVYGGLLTGRTGEGRRKSSTVVVHRHRQESVDAYGLRLRTTRVRRVHG